MEMTENKHSSPSEEVTFFHPSPHCLSPASLGSTSLKQNSEPEAIFLHLPSSASLSSTNSLQNHHDPSTAPTPSPTSIAVPTSPPISPSSSSTPFFQEKQDFLRLKSFLAALEAEITRIEGTQENLTFETGNEYHVIRKRMEKYFLEESAGLLFSSSTSHNTGTRSSKSHLQPSTSPSKLPTYTLFPSSRIVADIFFSPETSKRIYDVLCHPKFVAFLTWIAVWNMIFVFCILTGLLSKKYTPIFSITVPIGCLVVLVMNVDIIKYCTRCFEWWYLMGLVCAYGIFFCLIFPDQRMALGILRALSGPIVYCLQDAVPAIYRRNTKYGYVLALLNTILVLVGVHFDLIPDIRDYKLNLFNTYQWNGRQIFESVVFNLIIWLGRFVISSCFLFPSELIVVKMFVQRGDFLKEVEKKT